VNKAAEYFSKNEEAIVTDIVSQMGKPITEARAEMKGFYALVKKLTELAPEALAPKIVKKNELGILSYAREPVGVAAIFSPWNYPVFTCANFLFTSVLAGNSAVVKHSNFTPLIGRHFEEAFKYAGTENIVRELMITHTDAMKVYQLPEIGFVGFTGSTEVGRNVQDEIADHRFIDYTLELGGSDAAYVAEDADIDYAAKDLARGAFYNAGQSCNGISRIYVHNAVYDEFLSKITAHAATLQMGDPMSEDTTLGPLTQADNVLGIQQQVEEAAGQGGRILIGGLPTNDAAGKGQFFEPTIIADAQNDMSIMMVETFGPVVGVNSTEGDEEVIKLINDSQYGLTAAIYSRDIERIQRLGPQLNVGTLYGNRCTHVDPYLPWSGRKNSGVGSSLSVHGFKAVTNPKSYNIKISK